jgi:hypothetical protein
MVDASPSALRDNTCHCATGLPSVIQDGSIGRGERATSRLVVSINARGIMAKPQTDEFKNGMLFKGMRMREGNPQRFKLSLRGISQSA